MQDRFKTAAITEIKCDTSLLSAFEGAAEHQDHQRMVLCLLAIFRLWRLRQGGELRSPVQGIAALESWEREVAPLGAITPQTVLVAVQTVLGSVGAPVVALCKFNSYTSRRSVLSSAWNASWDMAFLRQMRDSELGLKLYKGEALPTVLFTFDKHLAATSKGLRGVFSGTWPGGTTLHGAYFNPTAGLRREVVSNPRVMERLDSWLRGAYVAQLTRTDFVAGDTLEELDSRIERDLTDIGFSE